MNDNKVQVFLCCLDWKKKRKTDKRLNSFSQLIVTHIKRYWTSIESHSIRLNSDGQLAPFIYYSLTKVNYARSRYRSHSTSSRRTWKQNEFHISSGGHHRSHGNGWVSLPSFDSLFHFVESWNRSFSGDESWAAYIYVRRTRFIYRTLTYTRNSYHMLNEDNLFGMK